jgi:hypothetical protein
MPRVCSPFGFNGLLISAELPLCRVPFRPRRLFEHGNFAERTISPAAILTVMSLIVVIFGNSNRASRRFIEATVSPV